MKRYSKEFKEEALKLSDEISVKKAAQQLGIHRNTLEYQVRKMNAVIGGQLDELGRLEAAEHLAYCDKCTDRYTALLTADALADPPRDVRRTVMSTIWVRLMQSTYGRAAVAGVAAVLALTMWRTGALTFVTDHGSDLQALLPTVQVTLPEKQPPKILPEKLGRPVTSRPGENIYTRVSSVLESLLNAAENIKS